MHVLAPRGGPHTGGPHTGGFNRGPLRAAAGGVGVEIAGGGGSPPCDEDPEPRGWPAPAAVPRDRAFEADANSSGGPGYNGGVCGVSKNAFDRFSRPEAAAGDRAVPGRERNPFQDEPCGPIGARVGVGGTTRARFAPRRSSRLDAVPTPPQPEVFAAGERAKFRPDGAPTGGDTRGHPARHVGAFAAWVRRVGSAAESRPRPAPPPESGGPARRP